MTIREIFQMHRLLLGIQHPSAKGASVSLPGAGKRDAITQLETAPCVAGFYANIACSETPQVWGGALFPSVELLPSRT